MGGIGRHINQTEGKLVAKSHAGEYSILILTTGYSVADILKFTGLTTLDLEPNDILEAAKSANLEDVIIIGVPSGSQPCDPLYIAGTTSDMGLVNLLIDHAKLELLTTRSENKWR